MVSATDLASDARIVLGATSRYLQSERDAPNRPVFDLVSTCDWVDSRDRVFDQQSQRTTECREHGWLLPAGRVEAWISEYGKHTPRFGGQ